MLRLQQQCSFWSVLFIQVLLTLSLSLPEQSLETFRMRIPKKMEHSLCKQWTRQLKSGHRPSGDHQICASPSDDQAHHLNCLIQVGLLESVIQGLPPGGVFQWFLSLFWGCADICIARGAPIQIITNTSLNPTSQGRGYMQLVQMFLINATQSLWVLLFPFPLISPKCYSDVSICFFILLECLFQISVP